MRRRSTRSRFFAQAGQRWPYVMFVLDGNVRLERFDLEICEGGQIGAAEFFGLPYLLDTSTCRASSDGLLAGLPLVQVRLVACAEEIP